VPGDRAATVTAITGMDAETPDCPETIGTWLRGQRLARKWSVYEMARQLQRAARDDGELTVSIDDGSSVFLCGPLAFTRHDFDRLLAHSTRIT
jgi:hypothetical protein